MGEGRKTWFGTVAALFIVAVLGASFWRFYINRDFVSYDFTVCDYASETCFVRFCEAEDPRCNFSMTQDGLYYFKIQEKRGDSMKEYACSETALEQFSDILFDVTCSL